MNKTKKGIMILLTVALFTILVEYGLIFRYVYDDVMKEIPIRHLTIGIFGGLFIVFSILFHILLRFIKNHNRFLGVMFVLWGGLVLSIPLLTMDRLMMIGPITKVNTYSLYMTYVIAGLTGLQGIFASGAVMTLLRAIRADADEGFGLYGMSGVAVLSASFAAVFAAPEMISYEAVFFMLAFGLMAAGFVAERISFQISYTNRMSKNDLPDVIAGFLSIVVLSLLVFGMNVYYPEVLKLSRTAVLLQSGVMTVMVVAMVYFLERLVQNDVRIKVTVAVLAVLLCLAAGLYPGAATTLMGIGLTAATAVICQRRARGSVSAVIEAMGMSASVLTGYGLAHFITVNFGTYIHFTDRRNYYLPDEALFYGAALLMVSVVIMTLWSANKHKKTN